MLHDEECGVYDVKGLMIVYEMVDGHLRTRELFIYDLPKEAHFLLPLKEVDE